MTPDRFVRTSRRGVAGRGPGPSSQRPAVDASIKKSLICPIRKASGLALPESQGREPGAGRARGSL